VAVDPPEAARAVVEEEGLPFPILCDTDRRVVEAYGVLHPGAGPGGSDVAIPSHFLVRRDGTVAWRFFAERIQDRPSPERVLEAVAALPEG